MDFVYKFKWILFRISRFRIEYPKQKDWKSKSVSKSVWMTLDIQRGYPQIEVDIVQNMQISNEISKIRIGHPNAYPKLV